VTTRDGAPRARQRARHDDERGIAVVWMAIGLFLMLGVAAVAVDLVHGLLVAQQAQNAADAASLAGVVYLPNDPATASQTALDSATENGFGNGSGTTVTAAQSGTPTRLKVDITRTIPTFFAKAIGFSTLTIHESATADYNPPVALGSPENSLGYQPYRGVWAAVNGYCSAREDGDLRLSKYRSNRPISSPYSGGTVCPEDGYSGPWSKANDYYESDGYSYLVEVKKPGTQNVAIQVFDGPYRGAALISGCQGPGGAPCPDSTSWIYPNNQEPNVTTYFEVWNLNNTPLDKTDDTLVTTKTYNTCHVVTDTACTNKLNAWDTIANIGSGQALYRVKAYTKAGEQWSVGSNGFSLGARVGGGSGTTTAALPRCVNDPNEAGGGITYSVSCPHVYGEREMSLYANKDGGVATFYLSEVGKANAGKTMIITLFDPGEGGQTLWVLDPSGNAMPFTWKTDDEYGTISGSGTSLDISQRPGRLDGGHNSDYRFSDRILQLTIKIPSNYSPAGSDWWKLKYQFASSGVTDRTTWGVKIIGDPIRLVQ
jgi:Flp pilus assembly protein TadG